MWRGRGSLIRRAMPAFDRLRLGCAAPRGLPVQVPHRCCFLWEFAALDVQAGAKMQDFLLEAGRSHMA